MNEPKKVIIAEPYDIILEGLATIINRTEQNTQINKVYVINEIHRFHNDHHIDIILIDLILLHHNTNTFNKLLSEFKGTKWIGIVSIYNDRELCERFDDLVYINDTSSTIAKTINKYLASVQSSKTNVQNSLSERETDVLKLLVQGNSNKKIAEKLFISVHTVITHRKNLTQKLGIKSVAGLTIYAVVNNIIDVDDSLKSTI